ncbi:MAG: thioredoxin family protein [Clostridia bacterium]|nr:thioredoxin family protein [Clostridia bacterium]
MQQLTSKDFDEFIRHDGYSVVLFSLSGCKPCMSVRGQLEPIARQISCGVINIQKNIQLMNRYKLIGFPTIVLFKNGKEIDRKKGYSTTEQLEQWLDLYRKD